MNPDDLPNPLPTPEELAAMLGGPADAEARRVAESIATWRNEQADAERRVAQYELGLAMRRHESSTRIADAHDAKAHAYRAIVRGAP